MSSHEYILTFPLIFSSARIAIAKDFVRDEDPLLLREESRDDALFALLVVVSVALNVTSNAPSNVLSNAASDVSSLLFIFSPRFHYTLQNRRRYISFQCFDAQTLLAFLTLNVNTSHSS